MTTSAEKNSASGVPAAPRTPAAAAPAAVAVSGPAALLPRLRSLVPTLSRGPARVGEAILADPHAVVPMTLQQLAAHSQTSDASVIRLAQALGCSGYREFRALLAASTAVEAVSPGREHGRLPADISPDDPPVAVVEKLLAEEQQALADTAAALDLTALTRTAEAIGAARRVIIAGIGASGLVAQDLADKLARIGIIAEAVTEGHAALTLAAVLAQADLFIAVSASGETADIVEPLSVAAAAGVPTAAITVRPRSAVTVADYVLIGVAARESDMRSAAMSSRTGQLFVVDALFTLVFQARADEAGSAVRASHHMLAPRRQPKETR